MSTWTHVCGCIRIDGIPGLSPGWPEESVREIIGITCAFEDNEAAWDKCSVPCGCEGSLQYEVISAGEGMVLWTVPIWGDLREYEDISEIKGWFEKIVYSSGLIIRSAILEIQSGDKVEVVRFKEEPHD